MAKKPRIRYTQEFKDKALKDADDIGVSAVAKRLKIHSSMIYQWARAKKANDEKQVQSAVNAASSNKLHGLVEKEIAVIKEQIAALETEISEYEEYLV